MPQFSFLPRGLPISQIEKCIPKKWRQAIVVQYDQQKSNLNASETTPTPTPCKSSDELMIDQLLTSLKEFTSQGHLGKAFRVFSHIQHHVFSSSCCNLILQPISFLLIACADLKSLPEGGQLHAQIINLGFDQHPLLIPKLVTFYSSLNLLSDAHALAKCSRFLHPLSWNVVISAYIRNRQCGQALDTYKQMLSLGIRPDNYTYPSVLKACGEQLDLAFGREVHRSIDTSTCEWCLYVQNALIAMYGKCGDVKAARELFDKMPERDPISWNTMVFAYVSKGMLDEACELSESSQEKGIELNIITWNTIAGGFLQAKNFEGALKFISQTRDKVIHLDYVSLIIGLNACSHVRTVKLGKEIHATAIRSGGDEYDNVKNALITMYSRCEDLKHAYQVFSLIENKSLISWNSVISGFANWDKSKEATFLFREMLKSWFEPNYVTLASMVPLCARVVNLQHGKELHCFIIRREGFKEYLPLWNSLVDMYARLGKILEARRVFNLLSKKDTITYTSLIGGYGMQGKGELALELFEEMKASGVKPDHITMVAVLSACSHSGLVPQGQRVFEEMSNVYNMTPRLEHYACMVDLFGRAGLLKKAEEIIQRMPCQPSAAMWATLIGACHNHGNKELGKWAAKKMLETKPENSGYYVSVANMYGAAGCWNMLAEVRTSMRDLGVRKDPGCAWVDVGNSDQPFLAGDASMEVTNEIYVSLDGLIEHMKDAGNFLSDGFVADGDVVVC